MTATFSPTYRQSAQRSSGVRFLFILFMIVAVLAALAVTAGALSGTAAQDVSHAVLKHGSDAITARQCLNGDKQFYLFLNPSTKRYGTICEINGVWGVVITDEQGNEVTAFLKNKMRSLDQVITYMRNAGYQPVH